MLKLLNWWPNLYRENDPKDMTDAWAVSLADISYDAAMAGAVALSRTMTWPPAVAEICEAAKPYIGFQPDLLNVRVAIDAHEELNLPLPPWFTPPRRSTRTSCRQRISLRHCCKEV